MNGRDVPSHDGLEIDSLTDPATLRGRDDVRVSQATLEHESDVEPGEDLALILD